MGMNHFKCWVWKSFWIFGALSFALALTGFDRGYWLWNALVSSVLAVSIKLDCQSCKVCE